MMIVVTAVMLLLLPLLAWLQYNWLGQVSESEREQLKWTLRATARRFSQDFDHELTLAFAAFSPGDSLDSADDLKNFVARYDRWQTTAQHPQLVREVYLARLDEHDHLNLRLLNPENQQFVPREWPEQMQGLRQRLEDHYQSISQVLAQSARSPSTEDEASVRRVLRRSFASVAEDVPALIVTIFNPPVVRGNREIAVRPSSGVVIITLNQQYIQQELLPILARRHFGSARELNYNVAIVPRQTPRTTLYQFGAATSTPVSEQEAVRADVTAGMFGVRFDELRNLMRSFSSESGQAGRTVPDNAVAAGAVSSPAPSLSPAPSASSPPAPPNEDNRPWQVLIRHRAGSLDAAVASVRRRNLLLSFGILALLGISAGLAMLSARRVQQLAQQQIEFVAGVSHELRTPLAVIRSAGDNLADGVIRDNEQIRRYGGLIRNEGRRLSEMVEQVLEFAGTYAGRKIYELHPTSVSELIAGALAAVEQQIDEGDFRIEQNLEPGLPDILADAPALSRAVQNLLSNAMKYSGESRWIGLRARQVNVGRGTEVQLIVEDRGLGIRSDDLPNIFEPFYRSREVTAAQIHGNGLGLSLVKSIVEAHGGSIKVKSAPQRGSTFTICLPVRKQSKIQTSDLRHQTSETSYPA